MPVDKAPRGGVTPPVIAIAASRPSRQASRLLVPKPSYRLVTFKGGLADVARLNDGMRRRATVPTRRCAHAKRGAKRASASLPNRWRYGAHHD